MNSPVARCVAGCWGGGHVKWCHEVAKLGVPGVLPFPSPPVLGGRKNGAVEKRNRAVVEKQLGHGRKNWAVEEKNGAVEQKNGLSKKNKGLLRDPTAGTK